MNDVIINIHLGGHPMPDPNPTHRRYHLAFREKSRTHNPAPLAFLLRGLKVDYTLDDDEILTMGIAATDEFGNPTTLGLTAPTFTVADPTIVAVTLAPDNLSLVLTPTGKLGTTQIAVTETVPTLAAPLTGTINLTVVAGAASKLTFVPGTTVPNPAPPAPASARK